MRGKRHEKSPVTIIVGTKTDLAYHREVSYEEGQSLADELHTSYLEISAAINTNVCGVFESALQQLIEGIHGPSPAIDEGPLDDSFEEAEYSPDRGSEESGDNIDIIRE